MHVLLFCQSRNISLIDAVNECDCPAICNWINKRIFVPIEGIRNSSNIKMKDLLSFNDVKNSHCYISNPIQ